MLCLMSARMAMCEFIARQSYPGPSALSASGTNVIATLNAITSTK